MDLHGLRPVTQARLIIDSNKYSPRAHNKLVSQVLRESFHAERDQNPPDKRPLTINSTKANSGYPNYHPSCYGAFRVPIKAKLINEMNTEHKTTTNEYLKGVVQPVNNKTRSTAYGAITAELFFPSSAVHTPGSQHSPHKGTFKALNVRTFQHCICYDGAQAPGSIWQRMQSHRRVTTSECAKILRPHKGTLPFLNNGGKQNNGHLRPCTGILNTKMAVIEQRKKEVSNRIGTAQAPHRALMGKVMRVSTPQTAPEKRPESRYNRASLYVKLENGRGNSPEYHVPIIDMRFEEFAKQDIMPECWK